VLDLYGSGRISLSKAAQLLDTSTLDIVRIASERMLPAGATKAQQEKSRETAGNLSV
jgi:predicted HTH domain antitoxin